MRKTSYSTKILEFRILSCSVLDFAINKTAKFHIKFQNKPNIVNMIEYCKLL